MGKHGRKSKGLHLAVITVKQKSIYIYTVFFGLNLNVLFYNYCVFFLKGIVIVLKTITIPFKKKTQLLS